MTRNITGEVIPVSVSVSVQCTLINSTRFKIFLLSLFSLLIEEANEKIIMESPWDAWRQQKREWGASNEEQLKGEGVTNSRKTKEKTWLCHFLFIYWLFVRNHPWIQLPFSSTTIVCRGRGSTGDFLCSIFGFLTYNCCDSKILLKKEIR